VKPKTDDPFFREFFDRVPEDVAASFTDLQLDAIKLAFGARSRGSHAVDIRLSIPLLVRRVYVVFLAGGERRDDMRRRLEGALRPVWTTANAMVILAFLVLLTAATFAAVYAGKRALGVDVVPVVDMIPDKTIERMPK
jgi:hypothetical protein